jgi:hypothetical protein
MAVPERSRAQPKFWALGLGEPFIAGLCGKGIWLRLNGCVAAKTVLGLKCSFKQVRQKPTNVNLHFLEQLIF